MRLPRTHRALAMTPQALCIEQRIRFRPLGYMKTPMIRSSFAVRSALFREPQLPVELKGKGFAWPVLTKQHFRFFMPMAGSAHWFHK
jgi:hypothetical protein